MRAIAIDMTDPLGAMESSSDEKRVLALAEVTRDEGFTLIAPRPPVLGNAGALAWLRRNLFGSVASSVVTIVVLLLLGRVAASLLDWGVIHAVFAADADRCQAARGTGACWGVVHEKFRFIVFGRYPFGEQFRPLLATVLLAGVLALSGIRLFWRRWLAGLWLVAIPAFFVLMRGGVLGLSLVPTDLWGGLPLTILLAVFGIILASPLAVLVALGRRSKLPAIRSACIVYVELIRGVPLISVLFMASFMLPLFLPPGHNPDVLIRVLCGITLFSAAYLAEVVRAGLQAVPKGQVEAAQTLGLSYWQTQRKIVLPQALSIVVPSIVNVLIGIFKDTSLVTIVSLYELTGSLGLALDSDANWRPFKLEGYLFIAFVYFVVCFSMSRYSLWVERRAAVGKSR